MDSKSAIKEKLQNLEEILLKPEIRTSITKLENLLSDDFLEFTSSGRIKNKQDCLNGLSLHSMELNDFEIRVLSPNVILTTYRIYEVSRELHTLRSSIWKYSEGRWQMSFHQGTPALIADTVI